MGFSDGSDPYECCETTARYKVVPGTYMPSQDGLLFCTPCKEAHAKVFSGLLFRALLPRLEYKPSITKTERFLKIRDLVATKVSPAFGPVGMLSSRLPPVKLCTTMAPTGNVVSRVPHDVACLTGSSASSMPDIHILSPGGPELRPISAL